MIDLFFIFDSNMNLAKKLVSKNTFSALWWNQLEEIFAVIFVFFSLLFWHKTYNNILSAF